MLRKVYILLGYIPVVARTANRSTVDDNFFVQYGKDLGSKLD